MIRLDGPLKDQLEDPASADRVARLEQRIGARRLGRGAGPRRASLLLPAVGLAALAAAAALFLLRAPVAPAPAAAPALPPVLASAPAEAPDPYLGARLLAQPASALSWMRSEPELMQFELAAGGRLELDVPPGTGRRWVIDTGLARVEILGTQLSIARLADRVEIAVGHGRVRISAESLPADAYLSDGQRLVVRPRAASHVVSAAKAAAGVDALWEQADAARAAGDYPRALTELGRISDQYPADSRAGLASFIRARILQDTLQRPAEAAQAIQRALSLGLADDLREAARGRLLVAQQAAGDSAAATSAAYDYLAHHPRGPHAETARRLTGVDPR